jgi:hypothetical protein
VEVLGVRAELRERVARRVDRDEDRPHRRDVPLVERGDHLLAAVRRRRRHEEVWIKTAVRIVPSRKREGRREKAP